MQPIILWDIPSNDPKYPVWSSNVWKTRLTLDYKGLPYKVEWIEFPDIEAFDKKLGLPPTGPPPQLEHAPHIYTVPVIYDPNTNSHHVESAAIAKYLDETYPETKPVFPAGTHALQTAFIGDLAYDAAVHTPLFFCVLVQTERKLNPRSAEFWRRTREQRYGVKLETLATEERWEFIEKNLIKLKGVLESEGGPFLLGENIGMVDIVIAADLLWLRAVDEEGWAKIASLEGGWWGNWLKRFAQYTESPTL